MVITEFESLRIEIHPLKKARQVRATAVRYALKAEFILAFILTYKNLIA